MLAIRIAQKRLNAQNPVVDLVIMATLLPNS